MPRSLRAVQSHVRFSSSAALVLTSGLPTSSFISSSQADLRIQLCSSRSMSAAMRVQVQVEPEPEPELESQSTQPDNNEVSLIAVMGVTGSGKSNFLRLITGDEGTDGPRVGHSLGSCTEKTKAYECVLGGRQIVFYDTPGFDDTYRGDAEILADVANALSSSYRSHIKLTGIIYLHRIKDERMTNAIMRNLTMFRNLCGDDALKNVVLATTFWDELPDESKGVSREQELLRRPDWWGYLAAQGSRVHRFHNTRESALAIVGELLNLPAVTLQIQEEIIDQGLEINQTTAGAALNRELAELREQYKRDMDALREDKERAIRENNEAMQDAVEAMEAEKRKFMRQIESEQAALQADRREERRRMEQAFNDQLRRLERERKARDRRIEELDARLSTERADSNRRLQEALAESGRVVEELKAEMARTSEEEREKFERTIREVEARQKQSAVEAALARSEADKLSKQIRDNNVAMMVAGKADSKRLEAKIQELEAQRVKSETNVWDVLAPIASLGAAVLFRTVF